MAKSILRHANYKVSKLARKPQIYNVSETICIAYHQ